MNCCQVLLATAHDELPSSVAFYFNWRLYRQGTLTGKLHDRRPGADQLRHGRAGLAVQVDPRLTLDRPRFQHLKLIYDELPPQFAFNLNWRPLKGQRGVVKLNM